MGLSDVIYRLYGRNLQRQLDPARRPGHVAVILDGNRRWARGFGAPTASGHQAGAQKAQEFLGWCDELDINVVTLFLLSTDNLRRPEDELVPLLGIIEGLIKDLASAGRWRVHPVGALDVLPDRTATVLKQAADATRDVKDMHVNVAVGYGGRQEIADAVRALVQEHAEKGTPLEELAATITAEDIARHLYTKGQPDPDLVIRASGEQRQSGFLLWQSANSEYYFCEALWPDFRHVDFLRALRSYGERERRYGQ
ncbi:isoprenyl transferase [Phytoactinopolyspora alkaliphila]|uniref:Isoprenyl transferase n=1 Tax=Phytoactinopolyspora alkaliphila TaxID=1783498 RepID=A0A6N9YJV5_9ACTN|nr:isoprenyl transferase [Phytoactinopolyspora alkaliphila]NED95273.1 isoprenyl transferase [Phytoactinopolyspora alkaliphila]